MLGLIGIRKETKDSTERRAPLSPRQVKKLIQENNIQVIVQPSQQRFFSEEEYKAAGALISDDLSSCNLIFGVKEIPVPDLLKNANYCFFSHVIKGQPYNMPMLKKIIQNNDTLLDYELVRDEAGKRLIFFGEYAGYAGMVDSLWALGRRLEWEGIHTPFSRIKYALEYKFLDVAKEAIQSVGEEIRRNGLPEELVPFITGFTGYGHVSKGAQEIYDLLPVIEIQAGQLNQFMSRGEFSRHHVYKVEFHKPDMYEPLDSNKTFDVQEFTNHPERYRSKFNQYLPYLTMLINGIYWEPGFPRLVTRDDIRQLFSSGKQPRLRVIGDITCDVQGSIEVTLKATTYLDPVYVYDVLSDDIRDGWEGNGPVIMAVEKLPTEFPKEATESFGQLLLPFVPQLATVDYSKPLIELNLPTEWKQAIIVHRGQLTPDYTYLSRYLERRPSK